MSSEASLGPLDREAARALHDQISDEIRRNIITGRWPQHYKLRAEADLALALGVSRGTIRRALRTLIEENLLRQIQGRGTFVADERAEPDFSNPLRSMAEELDQRGVSFTTTVLTFEGRVPEARVAAHLELNPGQRAWLLERVRAMSGGAPVMYLRNWISMSAAPALDREQVESKSLFRLLEEDAGVAIALGRRTTGATIADDELARTLDVPGGSALVHIEQITYTEADTPIEVSDVWIPPSRMSLSSLVRR